MSTDPSPHAPHARRLRACSRILAAALVPAALFALAPVASASASTLPHGHRAPSAAALYPAAATRPAFAPGFRPPRSAPPAGEAARAHTSAAKPRKPRRPRKPALHGDPLRALLAFEAMQHSYYIAGSGLYAGEPFSYLWPFSQALAATVTMANVSHMPIPFRSELHARLSGLNSYLDINNSGSAEGTFTSTLAAFDGTVAPPAGPGGTKYYDDNDWVGIELMRAYELTHEPSLLGSAEAIMAFEMAAWASNPELPCAGGIPFSNSAENSDRNTVTTAPAAELAAQLYRATSNVAYLGFAESAYQWVRSCLLLGSGMYADHIDNRGKVEPMLWSYGQGTMIGAGVLLYQATGNSGYLYQARQTARAALAYFSFERLQGEIPFFPSVYFRNLMYLDSVTHDPPGAKLAQGYVDYAWQHQRLSGDLFVGGSPASAQLLVQAAIVQIYGLLSSSPATYF